MIHLRHLVSLHSMLLLCPIGVFAQVSDSRSINIINQLSCTPFAWVSTPGISDKAGMRVPITLDEKAYWYQFDTGANATIVYGTEALKRGWPKLNDWGTIFVRIPTVSVGGLATPGILAYPMIDMRSDSEIQGTVGLDLLLGQTVVLDFPGKHLCVMHRPDVPVALMEKTNWTGAEIRHGKLYVNLKVNGTRVDGIFFDTGASATDLTVDLDLWKKLTGLSSERDATTRFNGTSWGKPIEIVGAPALGVVDIGSLKVRIPTVFTKPTQPDSFNKNFYGAAGSMGNVLFFNEVVVLDLGVNPKFGILR